MKLSIDSTVRLNVPGAETPVQMPRLGLGVFRAGSGEATVNAVRWALEAGYRMIDTARVYRNEAEVGRALKQSEVPREEVFVTTKLWRGDHGYDAALEAFEASLRDLAMERVDLYLMHWPMEEGREESWRAMERIFREGRARAIGVSNFTRRHLDHLFAIAEVPPAVNQIELHPFLQQAEVVAASEERGVVVQAYCPLVRAQRMREPALKAIAAELGRTPAQILVRWSLQRGFVSLPKSSDRGRIRENAEVYGFALSEAQMARLDALEAGYRVAWDPTDAP